MHTVLLHFAINDSGTSLILFHLNRLQNRCLDTLALSFAVNNNLWDDMMSEPNNAQRDFNAKEMRSVKQLNDR